MNLGVSQSGKPWAMSLAPNFLEDSAKTSKALGLVYLLTLCLGLMLGGSGA
jgi:hypothetical protein